MIVGLTGGIGSGKTTVSEFFKELDIPVIDSDQITRDLVEPNQPALKKIVAHFGSEILHKNESPDKNLNKNLDENIAGTLDRKKLRNIIFNNPSERLWLENLLHPLVKDEIFKRATIITNSHSQPKPPYIIVQVPLLIESNFHKLVDRVLVIDCPLDIQIQRVVQRDKTNPEQVQTIAETQIDREVRLKEADDVIMNDSTLSDLKQKVIELHHHYKQAD